MPCTIADDVVESKVGGECAAAAAAAATISPPPVTRITAGGSVCDSINFVVVVNDADDDGDDKHGIAVTEDVVSLDAATLMRFFFTTSQRMEKIEPTNFLHNQT